MALAIYRDPRQYKELAKVYGVSVSTVGNIKTGRTWGDATGASAEPAKRRLTEDAVLAIYTDLRPRRDLAKEHGVSLNTIRAIKNGVTWAQVTGHKTGAAE